MRTLCVWHFYTRFHGQVAEAWPNTINHDTRAGKRSERYNITDFIHIWISNTIISKTDVRETMGWVSSVVWARLCNRYNAAYVNATRSRQNGRHFPDDNLKCIFLSENVWISIKISLKFVPRGPINNVPKLVQIMAWRRPGDKSLSELVVVSLLTYIWVTRPQWVNTTRHDFWHITGI